MDIVIPAMEWPETRRQDATTKDTGFRLLPE